jgi:hypothetical protein
LGGHPVEHEFQTIVRGACLLLTAAVLPRAELAGGLDYNFINGSKRLKVSYLCFVIAL